MRGSGAERVRVFTFKHAVNAAARCFCLCVMIQHANGKKKVKKPVRTPKPKVPEAPEALQKVAKVKPQFEILRGQYTLSFQ